MSTRFFRPIPLALVLIAIGANAAFAQLSQNMQSWMKRLNSGEFSGGAGGRGGRGGRGGAGGGRWVDGGKGYTAIERGEVVRYDSATGAREVLFTGAQLTPPGGRPLLAFEASADGKHLLFSTNPRPTMIRKTAYDYWVLDRTDHSWHKLAAQAPAGVLYAKLSPDGTHAAYVRDNNLYAEDIRTGAVRQLTSDGSPSIINGTSDWVYEEEFSLREGFSWSPDSRKIAYFQFDQSGVPEFALINYTDTLYPVITKYHYPKAGQTNSAVRVGVVSAEGGSTRWMKVPGDPRNIYIARMDWADNSRELILQHLNRLQNTNTVLLADSESGETRTMYRDQDSAWVDINRTFEWLEHGQRLLFTSEHDGWRHAYAISREGDARLITTGAFDLLSIAGIDEAGGWLYYIASPENATQRYLYRSRLDGSGHNERVTPADLPGTHTYNLSPDCHWAFHNWSRFDSPGGSDLVSLPDHKTVRVFQDNAALKAKVAPILAGRTEMVQAAAGEGVTLDGWLIRPSHFDAAKKYPIIVNVYGEPAATTVNDSWGGNNRLLMAALADDGYLIASFDNRGTPSPKGRAWRKVIYGSVGVLASAEQAAALRDLARTHPYVDLTRVGVFGWSGGGSMTLNLMFRHPELYKVGVAGAPVPDQTLYDSIYQERYMGLPADNPKGYHDGSPISFAEGLQGKLLIIHGSGDDNVHFQGTQRLLNRLIDLDKQFHFMEYPNRRHGISGVHLDTLRYGFFEEYLPAGGR
ncbi:MAG TPA: S9 family peptidase [Bryobacteraceae bacterium]|nr:S9 family peptidase [Bryobacteraceae bacterium]